MATPKVCGIETEYGIFVRGADITPMMASSLIVNAYSDDGLGLRAWDFAGEHPDFDARDGWRPESDYPEVEMLMANTVLTNGSRFYVDHAHPELSTPECRSVSDALLYDRAGEEIVRRAMTRANSRLPDGVEIVLHKNNSDGKGNSYGCHENYLVSRDVPFGALASSITTHFVTRQIFTGSGKVGVECRRDGEDEIPFQISQRADFFEEEVGLETTVRRPIVNTRDEPHCDPSRWRRLHVIAGDANMAECATYLKLGTTALVLALIEDGRFPKDLIVLDPVSEIRHVSHDPSLRHAITLISGQNATAIEVQHQLFECVSSWFATLDDDPTHGDGEKIISMWGSVLQYLDTNSPEAAAMVDWVAKKRVFDALIARSDLTTVLTRMRAIDLQYHDMNVDRCLAKRMGLRTLIDNIAAQTAMAEPPVDTRAYFRGECIRKWPTQVSAANWDSLIFDIGGPLLQRVPMMDPLKGTQSHVGRLLAEVGTVQQLLDALGHDSVESVADDPGW